MTTRLLLTMALLCATTVAWAQPRIEITLTAEVEVKQVVDGRETVVRVPAAEAAPGQVIFYTLDYRNAGDQPASGARLTAPIPPETSYVVGSAWGAGAESSFSIDGGQTYKKPALLSYKVSRPDGSQEERVATPEQYTHIQWAVATIAPGAAGQTGFQVRVK